MDQQYINRVEAYINGGLNAEEKRQFEQELVEDDALEKSEASDQEYDTISPARRSKRTRK